MKNKIRILGIISILVIFGFSIVSCGGDDDPIHTHSYSTAWSTDGTQHWHECSCGDKIDVANHSLSVWDLTTPDTYELAGIETRECQICKKEETRNHDPYGINGTWTKTSAPDYQLIFYGLKFVNNCDDEGDWVGNYRGTFNITENVITLESTEICSGATWNEIGYEYIDIGTFIKSNVNSFSISGIGDWSGIYNK